MSSCETPLSAAVSAQNTAFFKSSPSVRSFPKRTRRSPEIVLDVAREVAEGGEVETVGDVGEREAAAVPHLALARRAVGMGDIAFHTRLRDAIETVVDDDISLVEFHGAKLQKIRKPSLRLSCGIFRRIQESIMPLGKEFAFSV